MAEGMGIHRGEEELAAVYFDALAWDESQIPDLEWECNASRAERRVMRGK